MEQELRGTNLAGEILWMAKKIPAEPDTSVWISSHINTGGLIIHPDRKSLIQYHMTANSETYRIEGVNAAGTRMSAIPEQFKASQLLDWIDAQLGE